MPHFAVDIRYVPGHLDEPDAQIPPDLPMHAIITNIAANAFAKRAAIVHPLFLDGTEPILWHIKLVTRIHARLVAIQLSAS